MSNGDESPYTPPDEESAAAHSGPSPRVFLFVLIALTMAISYGLTFVWPGEDKSLSYLPRFLPSVAAAGIITKLLGLWPQSPPPPK